MQPSLANEELRAEYVRIMGSDLGRLCHELQDELELLRQKWREFQELFAKGDDRIELLNRVASNFFGLLQKLLFEDAMLHLCRLTDPSQTGKWTNLTIMRLAEEISDLALRAQVQTDAKQVQKSCQFARDERDKRLAHTDLVTYRNELASPLPDVTSKNVEDAVESMRALLNSVEQHYGLRPSILAYDPRGARSLVHYLEEAVRAKDNEEQRWRN